MGTFVLEIPHPFPPDIIFRAVGVVVTYLPSIQLLAGARGSIPLQLTLFALLMSFCVSSLSVGSDTGVESPGTDYLA